MGLGRKTRLLEFMEREQEDGGLTQEQAAAKYMKLYPPRRSVPGLVAEYHRVKRWMNDSSLWTEAEHRDLHEYATDHYAELRRGK